MEPDRYLTCEQLAEALDEYLDGVDGSEAGRSVDRPLRAAVDAHLAECATCPALVARRDNPSATQPPVSDSTAASARR